MKILYVTEFFPETKELKFTGGMETAVYYHVKNLSAKHQLTVIYRPQSTVDIDHVNANMIPCGPPTTNTKYSASTLFGRLLFTFDSIKYGLTHQYDVVVGTNFTSYLPAYVIGAFKRVPTVAIYPDVLLGRWKQLFGSVAGTIGELLETIILKLPWSAFIPISQITATQLMRSHIPDSKIHVVPLGVDVSSIQSIKVKKKSHPQVIAMARLIDYKRHQDLIHAMHILKQNTKFAKAKCIICGQNGPYRSQLEQLVSQLKLQQTVTIVVDPPRQTLLKHLASSHIFSLPSAIEGFGIVTVEAAAAGVPFVSSDIPATHEITHNGQGGILYELGNSQQLAQGIANLITDKKLYKTKQQQALKLAQEYDWAHTVSMAEKVYLKLVLNT